LFLCDDCVKLYKIERVLEVYPRSYGNCEHCGRTRNCYDITHGEYQILPPPFARKHKEEDISDYPDTNKFEEELLKATFENAKTNLTVAILTANSLGKKVLSEHLQYIRKELDNCDHHFK
jgi:hypothetical protein